jgi:hypothetical protein
MYTGYEKKKYKRNDGQPATPVHEGPRITHAVCEAVLTADAQSRKQRTWRLLSFEDMKPLFPADRRSVAPIAPDVCHVEPDAQERLCDIVASAGDVRRELYRRFPLLPAIFALWAITFSRRADRWPPRYDRYRRTGGR